ncbi:MAG: DNA repair protein RecO [Tepidiformaceae bacterium]
MSERPRTYKTEGVILRRRNIGEADSIFTVYSDGEGKFDAVAKGVRKAKSHMRGHLEPLTRSKLMVARGRSLDIFTQAETITGYLSIRDDLERGAAAMYCAELVDRFTIEHADHPGLYGLVLEILDALEADAPQSVVRAFELQLLSLMGYELQLDACTLCSGPLAAVETLLSPSVGGLVCANCRGSADGGRLLSVRALKVLRYARTVDLAAFAAVRIDAELGFELQRTMSEVIRYILDHDVLSSRYVDQVSRLAPRVPAAGPVASRPDVVDHVQ